jgi:hypothetical protein
MIDHKLGSAGSLSRDMKEMSRKVDHVTECVRLLLQERRLTEPVADLQPDHLEGTRCTAISRGFVAQRIDELSAQRVDEQ